MANDETAAATKGDIKHLIEIIDRRFRAVDTKLESHDARFDSMDRKIDRTKDSLILYIEGAKTQLSSQIDAVSQDSIDYKLSRRIDLLEARC